ncbi:MAG: helix-turn-helix transcriptional regulator, partial [Pirellulaceae bacterium]|nr:helix-turn-helix transcriptional regulator [Pirellulaceae bacterium]
VGDYLAMQIHSMRTRLGWTQKRLSDNSGVTQPQISNYETL